MPAVPRRPRSYAVLRLPDHPRPQLRFPSLLAYPIAGALFLAGQRAGQLARSRWSLVTGPPYSRNIDGE